VRDIARHIDIPFTVGGGISTVADVEVLLMAGADKVSVNSSAIRNPALIDELAKRFGSQCVMVAIDTKYTDATGWKVYTRAGTVETEYKTVEWARQVTDLGAGEILLTSMNNDGTKAGFALDITSEVARAVTVPVIASGGAGTMQHFADAFHLANADAALAASLFHFRELEVPVLKHFLQQQGVEMRI
jgi:cyclase